MTLLVKESKQMQRQRAYSARHIVDEALVRDKKLPLQYELISLRHQTHTHIEVSYVKM